jgi:putative ABC transport system permease protein
LEGKVSAFMLKKETSLDTSYLATELSTKMPELAIISPSRYTSNLADQFSGIGSILGLTALVVAVVVIPQVALVSTMVSNERRGEYGIMRALGGTKRMIFGLVFGETLLIALIGGLIGTAGTGLMFMIIERQLGTAFLGQFLWPSAGAIILDVVTALSIALLVGAISALYPAYACSKREPYEAIRMGGGL